MRDIRLACFQIINHQLSNINLLFRKNFECHSERAQRVEESVYFNRFLRSAPAAVLRQQDAGASVEMTSRPFYKALSIINFINTMVKWLL
jgi:hypothetical protein